MKKLLFLSVGILISSPASYAKYDAMGYFCFDEKDISRTHIKVKTDFSKLDHAIMKELKSGWLVESYVPTRLSRTKTKTLSNGKKVYFYEKKKLFSDHITFWLHPDERYGYLSISKKGEGKATVTKMKCNAMGYEDAVLGGARIKY